MNWKIPLFKIYSDETDVKSVVKVIRRKTYWATGPEIDNLEKQFSEYIGRKFAVLFNSGTSALHADLLQYHIKNEEVIVPSFSFISTANSVILAGAKPVFAEIENESFSLDPEDVKEKITKKTKAIMPIHYGGIPCKNINILKEIADDKKLILIEDAAESLGSKIFNKMVGTFGNSSMFSFCQNKIITAGEGGIITTDSREHYDKLKLIRSHGRLENKGGYFSTTKHLDYIQIGFNFRLSSISAALISSQLKKISKIINLRREKAFYYNKKLAKISSIKTPIEMKDSFNIYQMYTILLDTYKRRQKLKNHLEKLKIMSRIYFEPIHLKSFYKKEFGYKIGCLPITETISKKVLSLPIYPDLTFKEIDFIVNNIYNICE